MFYRILSKKCLCVLNEDKNIIVVGKIYGGVELIIWMIIWKVGKGKSRWSNCIWSIGRKVSGYRRGRKRFLLLKYFIERLKGKIKIGKFKRLSWIIVNGEGNICI